MEKTNWFQIQIKKIKLFFIYRKFEKSEIYKNAKIKFKLGSNFYKLGLEFDNSFEKIITKNKYLFDILEDILKKNNLEIIEDIDSRRPNGLFEYTLYKSSNKDQSISFYSKNDFSAAERIYFYVLENYK